MPRRVSIPLPRGPQVETETGVPTRTWLTILSRLHDAGGWVETYATVIESLLDVPTTLTSEDAGQLIALRPYGHVLRWTGTLWQFAPGDLGAGSLQTFGTGVVPQGDGWVLCNGQTTDYLIVGASVLTTQPFVTPVVAQQYFHR